VVYRCIFDLLLLVVALSLFRLLVEFKPRMEQLLADIVLMNEIAILAEQVEMTAEDNDQASIASPVSGTELLATSNPSNINSSSGIGRLHSPGLVEEDIAWSNVSTIKPDLIARGESTAHHDVESPDIMEHDNLSDIEHHDPPGHYNNRKILSHQSSSHNLVDRVLLDQWEDPVATMNKKVRQTYKKYNMFSIVWVRNQSKKEPSNFGVICRRCPFR
jgi:hypothetical protein